MTEPLKKIFGPMFKEHLNAPQIGQFNNVEEWVTAMNEYRKRMDELEAQAYKEISE